MIRYVAPIAARYGALAIQFLLVLLITRRLSQADAGTYFICFGLVATTFCLAGLGLPDGLVRYCSHAIATGRDQVVRRLVRRVVLLTVASCLVIGACAAGFLILDGYPVPIVVLGVLWWFCYAIVFLCAQALVGLDRSSIGSFFFYMSSNVCFLVTSVPYLLLTSPTLLGTLIATVCGAGVSMLAAVIYLNLQLRRFKGDEDSDLTPLLRTGAVIALSRVLQAMLYWLPVWVAGAALSTSDAGVMGTAGRLLVAVGAVIAALRFTVRPEIVSAAAHGDWERIERTGRTISAVATVATILALAGVAAVGPYAVDLVFGPSYAAVVPLLLILLVGVLGESLGGPVDEVLKMTGRMVPVFVGLLIAVGIEWFGALLAAPHGLYALAWVQAGTFVAMYGYQLLYLWITSSIVVLPLPSSVRFGRPHPPKIG